MDKHRSFGVMLSIFLLLPALFQGCTQPRETYPPGASATLSTEQPVSPVEYRNTELGFSFSLPASWEGFSLLASNWEGSSLRTGNIVAHGLKVSIIHPKSTAERPRQEIPILVFTLEQWDQMQGGEWHIGAAPINPLELGRNGRYVFALPARYNYAFLEGWEEVEQILQENPLMTFEPNIIP